MTLVRSIENYFAMFRELSSSKTTPLQKSVALLKIFSLFTVVVPLVFGILYFSLQGRVSTTFPSHAHRVNNAAFGTSNLTHSLSTAPLKTTNSSPMTKKVEEFEHLEKESLFTAQNERLFITEKPSEDPAVFIKQKKDLMKIAGYAPNRACLEAVLKNPSFLEHVKKEGLDYICPPFPSSIDPDSYFQALHENGLLPYLSLRTNLSLDGYNFKTLKSEHRRLISLMLNNTEEAYTALKKEIPDIEQFITCLRKPLFINSIPHSQHKNLLELATTRLMAYYEHASSLSCQPIAHNSLVAVRLLLNHGACPNVRLVSSSLFGLVIDKLTKYPLDPVWTEVTKLFIDRGANPLFDLGTNIDNCLSTFSRIATFSPDEFPRSHLPYSTQIQGEHSLYESLIRTIFGYDVWSSARNYAVLAYQFLPGIWEEFSKRNPLKMTEEQLKMVLFAINEGKVFLYGDRKNIERTLLANRHTPLFFPSGWTGHSTSVTIYESFLILGNRGERQKGVSSGLHITPIFPEEVSAEVLDLLHSSRNIDLFPGNRSLFHKYIERSRKTIALSDQTLGNCTWSSSALLGIMTTAAIAVGGRERWEEVLQSYETDKSFMTAFEAVSRLFIIERYIDNYLRHAETVALKFDHMILDGIFAFTLKHFDEQPDIYGALLRKFIDSGICVNMTYLDDYKAAQKAVAFLQSEYHADDDTICLLLGLYKTPGLKRSRKNTSETPHYYLEDGKLLKVGT